MNKKALRHILSLSGGKDSTALALFMKGKILDIEYVFCDTGEELPETYEYLDRLEAYLGRPIIRLNPDRPFRHYLDVYGGVLPNARTRWCTRMLKIKPFERYAGEDQVISYIAIRADEMQRTGYISTKSNVSPRYPFIEAGIEKEDVLRILMDSGLGLPRYYEWRSRSGCYFCFFQQRNEWVGLLENHPDLFEAAQQLEKPASLKHERFTWNQRESLEELRTPERVREIKAKHLKKREGKRNNSFLINSLSDDEDTVPACWVCHL